MPIDKSISLPNEREVSFNSVLTTKKANTYSHGINISYFNARQKSNHPHFIESQNGLG